MVGAAPNGTPLLTDVPVVVLTTPQQVLSSPATVPATPPAAPTVTSPVAKADDQIVSAAIKKVREQLKPNQQGGYAASAVGQVLAQMGHDKATRARIVKQIPKLKEVGSGPEKRLIF